MSIAYADEAPEILVAAAADLEPLQTQWSASFARTTGCHARFTFASSGTLARQIENGAPYDVYLSANEAFVKQLLASGRLQKDSVQVYAHGRIALWSRSGQIRSVADLLRPGLRHVAIANPLHAPYGQAAREALQNQGLWEKLVAKMVYGENVQQTFQYAESGNADAAITAWSLVFDKGGILLPASWHAPIRQAGGVVAGTKNPICARRFLEFVTKGEGKKVLARYGFY